MKPEVKQAAERATRAKSEPLLHVYPECAAKPRGFVGEWTYTHQKESAGVSLALDLEELASAYLAEYLEDDDEPVGDFWWKEVSDSDGLICLPDTPEFFLHWSQSAVVLQAEGSEKEDQVYTVVLLYKPNRGQVRKLCSGLGIDLRQTV